MTTPDSVAAVPGAEHFYRMGLPATLAIFRARQAANAAELVKRKLDRKSRQPTQQDIRVLVNGASGAKYPTLPPCPSDGGKSSGGSSSPF